MKPQAVKDLRSVIHAHSETRSLDELKALELWSNGFGVEGRGARHVLLLDDAWMPAEMLRILAEKVAAAHLR